MKIYRIVFAIILSLLVASGIKAQNSATEGKDFYISFTQNYQYGELNSTSACQIRYVVTTSCYITAQYGDGTYIDNNVMYTPGVYTKVVDKTKCQTDLPTNGPFESNRIIRITSTENIGVFAINIATNTTDGTTVLPKTALGNNYTIISQDIIEAPASIQVIALENGTVFSIKDPSGVAVVSNKTLSAGTVYTYAAALDLTGYTVESNYNVAVISAIRCGKTASGGACDTNYEQMWPTNTAGKNYFLWNMGYTYPDQIRILALEDNTEITKKQGTVETNVSLNKNQKNIFALTVNPYANGSSAPVKITANKPIIVENILGFAPSIKWISSVEQRITRAYISPFVPVGSSVLERHHLHLMIPAGTENQTTIIEKRNGVSTNVTLNFYSNLSDPNYVIANKEYAKTDDVLIDIENPAGFIAYMAGYGAAESYIITAGAGAFNLQAYYTIGTQTTPYNDTYYTATSAMTHSFEDTDNITVKRTIEKSFTTVKWLINGAPYTGVTENTNSTNTISIPASELTGGENELTMSVRYSGASADSLYVGKVWLSSITDYPDNVDDPTCSTVAGATTWSISESLPINTTDLVHNYGPLVTGDIDADGKVEIIALANKAGSQNLYDSDGIKIFNYEDGQLKLKKHFTIPVSTASFGAIAIARYNNRGYIVFAGTDKFLYAYDPNGTLIWKSNAVYGTTVTSLVNIADFNNDGIPEVYVGNNIFSLATGNLLCSGGTNNSGVMSNNSGSSVMAINIDNDPARTLELIAGTQIYQVVIPTNGTTSTGCSMTLMADLEMIKTLPANALKDGMTQVVDIDNDGQLEVVVSTLSAGRLVVYVWKPQTGGNSYIMGSYTVPATGVTYNSVPMIGDIDSDGYPEIVFITNGNVWNMYALELDPNAAAGSMLNLKWTLTHSDGSGCTGMSLFDFNQDGIAEIVYRDETTLRIIDGSLKSQSTPKVLNTFSNVKSATLREYPIIADIDKDGQAEIIVTGWDGTTAGADLQNNYIRVFKSGGSPWAPARTVWNQYHYNGVNVNEDLTIPQKQFPIATKFKGEDGVMGTSDDIRVFNNFRQQQTYIDRNGMPYMTLPNVKIIDPNDIVFTYHNDGDSLVVSNLKIKNEGQAATKPPLKVTTYKNQVVSSPKQESKNHNIAIGVGETKTISYTINNFSDWMPVNKLIVRVNDAGNGLNDQQVCDSCCNGNESDAFAGVDFDALAWADSYRKCVGETVILKTRTLPGANVEYRWFKPDLTALATTQNTSVTNLTLTQGGKYVFKANKINGNLSVEYILPYLSVAPSVMYWSGAQNSDWNSLDNWQDGSKTAIKAVPSGCTTVHIPSGLSNYPKLDAVTTAREVYGEPTVDNVIFHYGSELAYPHKLNYKKAYVHYNFGYYNTLTDNTQPTANKDGASGKFMKRGQWYPVAAPLKKMVSGDFSLGGYPFIWQAMPDILSGEDHPYSIDFTKNHPTNDIDLRTTNNSIALNAALYKNTGVGYNNHKHLQALQGVIEIPYFENAAEVVNHPGHQYDIFSKTSTLFYFDTKTLQRLNSPVGKIKRSDDAYRFVYEKDDNTVANVTLSNGETVPCYAQTVSPNNSGYVLLGNPFMSTINMKNFLDANTAVLKNTVYYAYDNSGSSGIWKSYNYIAGNGVNSLQAFVVVLKTNAPNQTLYFPLEGTLALTGTATNKIPRRIQFSRALSVTATNAEGEGGDFAELIASDLQEEEVSNVDKIMSPESAAIPEVFFIGSSGNDFNLVQNHQNEESRIGLGVKCSNKSDDITFTFSDADQIVQNNDRPILVDKLLGVEQDLVENPVYRFKQNAVAGTENNYTDIERFSIRFGDPRTVGADDDLEVSYLDGNLSVRTQDGIVKVEVYNLLGQLFYASKTMNPAPTYYQHPLNLIDGSYIIKIQRGTNNTTSKKIAVGR